MGNGKLAVQYHFWITKCGDNIKYHCLGWVYHEMHQSQLRKNQPNRAAVYLFQKDKVTLKLAHFRLAVCNC